MIKIGIVGCGRMTDQLVDQIVRIPNCRIAGVCDRELLMGRQLAERYHFDFYTDSVETLIEKVKPQVVHIVTPPKSHYAIGKMCLERGCHVFMEKPFTVNYKEARELIRLANSNGLKITVDHKYQFNHVEQKMRALVKDGFLGGDPVHMESVYCYNFKDPSFAKALLGDHTHWVRSLPGKLLQNVISHGICRIAEFWQGDNPKIKTFGYSSPTLKQIGENGIIDELRVLIKDENQSANFTFSSQIFPSISEFRLYGPRNFIIVDDANQIIIKGDNKIYKSYLKYFIPPIKYAMQYRLNGQRNLVNFIRSKFHYNSGLKCLMEQFYKAVSNNSPLPITYKEILLTTKMMDDIFETVKN